MRQIVYFSTASGRQDTATVGDIVSVSRIANRVHGISGLLVAGGHRYLQVIEGKADEIGALIRNIRADRRHVGVTVMADRPIARRSFRGWSMARFNEPQFGEVETLHELVHRATRHNASLRLIEQLMKFADEIDADPMYLPRHPWRDDS